jgi:hypothetical protein
MKHPTQEQWMDFLYGELPRRERKQVEQHLQACEPCARQHTDYAQTLARLDRDTGTKRAPSFVPFPAMLKWAAAAALLVTTGFTTARLAAPPLRPEVIEAQIAGPLREKLAREMDERAAREAEITAARLDAIARKAASDAALTQEQFAVALARLKERDAALYAAFKQVQAGWRTQHQALREDLEKVALFTDRSARSTERQLVQLTAQAEDPAFLNEDTN